MKKLSFFHFNKCLHFLFLAVHVKSKKTIAKMKLRDRRSVRCVRVYECQGWPVLLIFARIKPRGKVRRTARHDHLSRMMQSVASEGSLTA